MMAVDLKMEVYTQTLELIGFLETQDSVIWVEKAFTAGSFSIEFFYTRKALMLLQPENIIWIEGDVAGIIEYVEMSGFTITVKGRTLTGILDRRVLWGLYSIRGTVPEIMHTLVNDCCINPTRGDVESRKIPGLVSRETPSGGDIIRYQATGGTLLERLEALGETYGVAFGVAFNPAVPCMEFWTRWGQNRSVHQSGNLPVLYSTELDDVLKSEYTYNSQDYRNVALVGGEGEGPDRVYVTVNGDDETPTPPTPPGPTTTYTVALDVDPEGGGSATGGKTVTAGTSITITATPSDGFEFVEWRENSVSISKNRVYTFTVNKDRALTAVFKKESRLPEGYTEVQYIQSDGKQCIDTGIKPTSATKLTIDIETAVQSESSYAYFVASYSPSAQTRYYLNIRQYSGEISILTGEASVTPAPYKVLSQDVTPRRLIITVDYPNKTAYISGENTINLSSTSISSSMSTLKFLAYDTDGSYGTAAKLFSAKISNSNTESEWIPCTNPDGEAGLYDLVGGKFYGNAGTGAFTAGPAV